MKCTFTELMNREVICTLTGEKLGYIDDLILDTESCIAESFIIKGRAHMMGLMGRDEDITIPCTDIEKIGSDTVLVKRHM